MILLDTNIVSELMRDPQRRHPQVTNFLAAQNLDDLYVPSMAIAEIQYGIQKLPAGKRRRGIEQGFTNFMSAGFGDRLVNFTSECATAYATARTTREKSGRPVSVEDALIGGMALAYKVPLATRNIDDFTGYGLTLINPWAA